MPKHYAPIAGVNAEEFVGELPGWLFSTVKYIWRAPNKNGVEDVIKALDCLDRYIGDTVEFHLSPSAKAAEADEVIGFISAIAHSELTENQKERLIVDETLLKFREYVVGAKEGIEKNL